MPVAPSPQTVCWSCRFRFLAGLKFPTRPRFSVASSPSPTSVDRTGPRNTGRRRYISTSIARGGSATVEREATEQSPVLEAIPSAETTAQHAWHRYGGSLPKDLLSPEEYQIYERLYGVPRWVEQRDPLDVVEEDRLQEGETQDPLAGMDEEELGAELEEEDGSDEVQLVEGEEEGEGVRDDFSPRGAARREHAAAIRLREDIQRAVDEEPEDEPEEEEEEDDEEEENEEEEPSVYSSTVPRAHPLTTAGKFSTSPATVHLPYEALTGPVTSMLRSSSNKHISQIAHRELGGPGLPYSPATPASGRQLPQTPIRLQASQSQMGEIEGDVFLAAIMPGTYAAVLSVLVEVRKRLGGGWLRELWKREGGPRVLDVGGGGAGIVAWREVLKAEWRTMQEEDDKISMDKKSSSTTPVGSSTIVTGSAALRHRASRFLDNATFLPRLPDYVHVTPEVLQGTDPAHRKQYDVVLAPHTLWPLYREHQRKFHVQNLWSLLNPDGGVLILLEKGLPKGFEAIAGARQYLLNHHIPSFEEHVQRGTTSVVEDSEEGTTGEEREREHEYEQERSEKQGMIIAPCTNHVECPMYSRSSNSLKNKKTWCHFSQRYLRPNYLQRIIGAKDRNHEDVKFSYVAVRKGRDERRVEMEEGRSGGEGSKGGVWLVQGDEASDASFAGLIEEENGLSPSSSALSPSDASQARLQSKVPSHDDYDVNQPTPAMATTDGDLSAFSSSENDDIYDELEDSKDHKANPAEKSSQEMEDKDKKEDTRLQMWSHPRTLLPPLKRRGHVLLDVCTPSGTLERWTIPKSFGRQAYRDARKSKWGDIWCLGGKTRIPRSIRGGKDTDVAGVRNRNRNREKEEEEDEEDEEGMVRERSGGEGGGAAAAAAAAAAAGVIEVMGRKGVRVKKGGGNGKKNRKERRELKRERKRIERRRGMDLLDG